MLFSKSIYICLALIAYNIPFALSSPKGDLEERANCNALGLLAIACKTIILLQGLTGNDFCCLLLDIHAPTVTTTTTVFKTTTATVGGGTVTVTKSAPQYGKRAAKQRRGGNTIPIPPWLDGYSLDIITEACNCAVRYPGAVTTTTTVYLTKTTVTTAAVVTVTTVIGTSSTNGYQSSYTPAKSSSASTNGPQSTYSSATSASVSATSEGQSSYSSATSTSASTNGPQSTYSSATSASVSATSVHQSSYSSATSTSASTTNGPQSTHSSATSASASATQTPYKPNCNNIKYGSKVAAAPGFSCSEETTTCSAGECCTLCTGNPVCVGWNYCTSTGQCTLLLANPNMCPSFCVLTPQPARGYDAGLGPCVSYPNGMPGWGY